MASQHFAGNTAADRAVQVLNNSGSVSINVQLNDSESKCLQSLRTSSYEEHKDRNPSHSPNTCLWLLQNEDFTKWKTSPQSSLLWVSADPGCGKSVLAKRLVDDSSIWDNHPTICYFFFKDGLDEQTKLDTALCALLHQLFSQQRQLLPRAVPAFEANGVRLTKLPPVLWRILLSAASDPTAGEILCIIDALDECNRSDCFALIDMLNAFYSRPEIQISNLKFLVTSRPYIYLERHFESIVVRLKGEDETTQITDEIAGVIRHEVPKIAKKMRLDEPTTQALLQGLLAMKNRTYLWLDLVSKDLMQRIRIKGVAKMEKYLQELPNTVEAAYERILNESLDEDEARKILQIIVAAYRPLTVAEMSIALNFTDGDCSFDDIEIDLPEDFESTIKNLCGLFVTVVQEKVFLIHQTAREFLLASPGTSTQNPVEGWRHSVRLAGANALLTGVCLRFLAANCGPLRSKSVPTNSQPQLPDDMAGGKFNHVRDLVWREIDHPNQKQWTDLERGALMRFFKYSTGSWGNHYQAALIESNELDDLLNKITDPESNMFAVWSQEAFGVNMEVHKPLLKKLTHRTLETMLGRPKAVQALLAKAEMLGSTGAPWDQDTVLDMDFALIGATLSDRFDNVQLFLRYPQIDVNFSGGDFVPLYLAIERKNLEIVQLLLKHPRIDVNKRSARHNTALDLAITIDFEEDPARQMKIIEALLSHPKMDVNTLFDEGETVLTSCVDGSAGDRVDVKEFMRLITSHHSFDVRTHCHTRNRFGQTLLHVAVEEEETLQPLLEILSECLHLNPNIGDEYNYDTPLHNLATSMSAFGHIGMFLSLPNINVNARNKDGNTPLHLAILSPETVYDDSSEEDQSASEGEEEASSFASVDEDDESLADPDDSKDNLASKGSDYIAADWVDSSDDTDGEAKSRFESMTPLLEHPDLKIDTPNGDGKTALHLAAQGQSVVWVTALLKHNANPHSRDALGCTPLHRAAGKDGLEIMELLLERGAHVNEQDANGDTPLHWAVRGMPKKVASIAEILVRHGADVNALSFYHETPLLLAMKDTDCLSGKNSSLLLQALESLASLGADCRIRNRDGQSGIARLYERAASSQSCDLGIYDSHCFPVLRLTTNVGSYGGGWNDEKQLSLKASTEIFQLLIKRIQSPIPSKYKGLHSRHLLNVVKTTKKDKNSIQESVTTELQNLVNRLDLFAHLPAISSKTVKKVLQQRDMLESLFESRRARRRKAVSEEQDLARERALIAKLHGGTRNYT